MRFKAPNKLIWEADEEDEETNYDGDRNLEVVTRLVCHCLHFHPCRKKEWQRAEHKKVNNFSHAVKQRFFTKMFSLTYL